MFNQNFFNSFSIDLFFVLFSANLLSRLNTVLSKLDTNFVCDNLALKTSAAKVLNSGVVIYLS